MPRKIEVTVYHRPADRKERGLICNRKQLQLSEGTNSITLFTLGDREWLRSQIAPGREVLLTPDV